MVWVFFFFENVFGHDKGNMRFMTLATHSDGYLPWLQRACTRYGVTLQILGDGRHWEGYQTKTLATAAALRAIPPDELVCVIDAYDVMLVRDPTTSLERDFAACGAAILVACETHGAGWSGPLMRAVMEFGWGRCHRHLVNSGMVMGRTRDLRPFYRALADRAPSASADDQRELVRLCNARPEAVVVDCTGAFCAHVMRWWGSILDEPGLAVARGDVSFHGQRPYLVHGFGNTDMDELIQALGYPMTSGDRRRLRAERRRAFARKVWHYSSTMFQAPLLILLLLLLLLIWWGLLRRKRVTVVAGDV